MPDDFDPLDPRPPLRVDIMGDDKRRRNRERAALRLVEVLTPAAALGIECPDNECRAPAGEQCYVDPWYRRGDARLGYSHEMRELRARAELHALLIQLGVGE